MITNLIVRFLDGVATNVERKEVEKYLLTHPEFMDVFGGLARIKKELPPDMSLKTHFENHEVELWQTIESRLPNQ
jgi:hypothetical protein